MNNKKELKASINQMFYNPKRFMRIGILFLFLSLLILIWPAKASNLHIRFTFEQYNGEECNLYYTTVQSPDYSGDKRIISTQTYFNPVNHCNVSGVEYEALSDLEKENLLWMLEFTLPGEYIHQITGLRLDFPDATQTIAIKEITLSSGGIITQTINPALFFGEMGISSNHSISEQSILLKQKKAYLVTSSDDPYVVLTPSMVQTINQGFSQNGYIKFVLIVLLLICCICCCKDRSTLQNSCVSISEQDCLFSSKQWYLFGIFAVLYGYLTLRMVLPELQNSLSDYSGHLYTYLPLFSKETLLEGWQTVPYFLWHLMVLIFYHILQVPLEMSAAYTSAVFAIFSYGVISYLLHQLFPKDSRIPLFGFALCMVQSLYFYWLDAGERFQGVFSMNPYHNPTQMCVQALSLLCFGLVIDIWGYQEAVTNPNAPSYQALFFKNTKSSEPKLYLKKCYIILSICLFLSVLAKPTFAEMFIPATGMIMLIILISKIIRKDQPLAYFRHLINTFICAVPTLLYILLQFLDYFVFGGSYGESGSVIITGWMEVWKLFSENPTLSILLAMAFPIYVLILDVKGFVQDKMGLLGLISYCIGILEASTLGESGWKLSHGDFLWPMMSGMLLLWVAAFIRFLKYEKALLSCTGENHSKDIWGKAEILIGWFLFFSHVLCGILYIRQLMGIIK